MPEKKLKRFSKKMRRKWRTLEFVAINRIRFKNFDETFIFVVSSLVCGLLIGGIYGYSVKITPKHKRLSLLQSFMSVKRTFSPMVSVPGSQTNNDYVFADFESAANFGIFEAIGAHLEPDSVHGRDSAHSGRIQFFKGSRMSGVRINAYFSSRYAENNWAGYRYLKVYGDNPANKPLKFVIQIKDDRQKRYNARVELDAFEKRDITVNLAPAAKEINLRNVKQVNLFIWENSEERELFIDDLRLTDPIL